MSFTHRIFSISSRKSALVLSKTSPLQRAQITATTALRSASSATSGTDKPHTTGGSVVPEKAQEKLPKGVEDAVPDSVHDTSSSKSHATGDSIVPEFIQKVAPKAVEEALPDSIHDTSPKGNKTGGQNSGGGQV